MDSDHREKIIEYIRSYEKKQPIYKQLATILEQVLSHMARDLHVVAIIQAREKTVASFAEKIQRPGKHYINPLEEISDFCGARVILPTLEDIKHFSTLVEEHFNQWESSEDKEELLKEAEFGYRSKHFWIMLRQGSSYLADLDVPDE